MNVKRSYIIASKRIHFSWIRDNGKGKIPAFHLVSNDFDSTIELTQWEMYGVVFHGLRFKQGIINFYKNFFKDWSYFMRIRKSLVLNLKFLNIQSKKMNYGPIICSILKQVRLSIKESKYASDQFILTQKDKWPLFALS